MASMMDQKIQDDWTNREFIELLAANIKRIADFLNKFGDSPFSIFHSFLDSAPWVVSPTAICLIFAKDWRHVCTSRAISI